MSTWGAIRALYLTATGDSPAAKEESWTHLTDAYREVASRLDVPELAAIDESVTVAAEADFVTVATIGLSLFAIKDVFNVTDGVPIYPEHGGMTARNRFLDTTGKPPLGNITNYARDGVRLYVRDTPSVATVLRVRVKQQTPTLVLADTNNSPLTPEQYDRAIVYKAAEMYYTLHPRIDGEGSTRINFASKFRDDSEAALMIPENPRVDEDRPQMHTMRLAGYRLGRR